MWFRSLLEDSHNGSVSSKRLVTLIALTVCALSLIADTLGYKVNPALFENMVYIVIAGLGFTASEKFTKKEPK